jgi:BirA family transcriptional regulator, biotin operon repressor / biotin---[acetyl-CoA-carboxylase] ligase
MVNETIAIRQRLLQRLRTAPGAIGGNTLAEVLGVSRVAVWKHFQTLRGLGYDIRSSRSGYRLASDGDFIHPWEFAGREDRVVHLASVRSTMEHAREMALEDARCGAVVVAERQTAGRGRRGRQWASPIGGLFFTLVLAPTLAPEHAARVVMAGTIALCRTLRHLTGAPFQIEWPNDIYLRGRKVAGLLADYLVEGGVLRFLNLGVGTNVANRAPGSGAISLADVTGPSRRLSRRLVLERFLDHFEALDLLDGAMHEEWRRLSGSVGREVVVDQGGRSVGRAAGIDQEGRLVVERRGGGRGVFWPGEVRLRSKEGRP